MDWHAQTMIYIVLEMSQLPLIIPRTYCSLFMAALTQCHNPLKTNDAPSRKHSVTALSRNVKAKRSAETRSEEP